MCSTESSSLSITTDYAESRGDPLPYLKRISEAGFTHIHWCHEWNTDIMYSQHEIDRVKQQLEELQLRLLDLHGSAGQDKNWGSPDESQRRAGVELVKNRIDMTAQLGGSVVIMHIPDEPGSISVRKSLNELEYFSRDHHVKIAIENGIFESIIPVLSEYDPGYIGLCYDSGHGNMKGKGLENLSILKDRLISIHLHDNDGISDQHKLLFSGTIDWEQLASIIGDSAYSKCISMEVSIKNSDIKEETAFLNSAFDTGMRFSNMVYKR
jgi:sugar phosphate isomerase/epimerase